MKRVVALFLCFFTLLSAASCDRKQQPTGSTDSSLPETTELSASAQSDSDKPSLVFMLEELPELPPYTDRSEKFERFYPEYTSKFLPGENYGTLIPFNGSHEYFRSGGFDDADLNNETEYYETIAFDRYGLMTVDGKIVVDAVYDEVDVRQIDGKTFYSLTRYSDEDENIGQADVTVLPADGKWSIEAEGYASFYDGGRIVINEYDGSIYDSFATSVVYDTQGKKLFTMPKDNRLECFSDGIFTAYHESFSDEGYYKCDYYCVDANGKKLFAIDGYSPNGFENGYAVICTDEFCGMIDTSGEWILKPIYQRIAILNDKYIAVEGLLTCQILDFNKKKIAAFRKEDDNDVSCHISDDGTLLFEESVHVGDEYNSYFYKAITKEPVVCAETGEPATHSLLSHRIFYYIDDENVARFFDINGKEMMKVKNTMYAIEENEEVFSVATGINIDTETEEVTECKYYRADTGKEIFSRNLNGESDEYYYLTNVQGTTRYALANCINKNEIANSVYDLEKNCFIFEDREYIELFVCDFGIYFSVLLGNTLSVFDEDMNEIVRVNNGYTD